MHKRPFTSLTTEHLDLKPFPANENFAQELLQLIEANRTHLAFAFMTAKVKTLPQAQRYIRKKITDWEKMKSADYLVYLKDTDELLGLISMEISNYPKGIAETGGWLVKKYEGSGYSREAFFAIEQEFVKRGLRKLEARHDPDNKKSANLIKRLGFSYDTLLPKNMYDPVSRKYVDLCLYSKHYT